MPDESNEVKLARLEERMSSLLVVMEVLNSSNQKQLAKLDEMNISILTLNNRVEKVENNLALASPTLQEFIATKNKVMGAGTLGKYVWMAIGVILSIVISFKETLHSLVNKL